MNIHINTPSSVAALDMPTPVAEPAPDNEHASTTHYFDGGADAVIRALLRKSIAHAIEDLEHAHAQADSLSDHATVQHVGVALRALRQCEVTS